MKVIIVGASFARISAAFAVRQQYQQADIYLIEQHEELGFLSGGLHLYLQGRIDHLQAAKFIEKEQLTAAKIHLLLGKKVVALDPQQQLLTYCSQAKEQTMSYDKLILATGAGQWSHKIKGNQSDKILKYKYQADAQVALKQLQQSQSVAIIGGGQIGSEALDSLLSLKKDLHLFESMDYLLAKYFDEEMVQEVQAAFIQVGVHFHFGETVASIQENETSLSIATQNQVIQTDCSLFALNMRPHLSYLNAKIQQRADQTIVVDKYLQTTTPSVFAIGDCIDLPNPLGEKHYLPLVNNAVRAGLIVACNLTAPTVPFVDSLRTIATKLLDFYLASTGMTEAEGIFYPGEIAVAHVTQFGVPFATKESISGKLVYDKQTHQVLGAQLVSKVNCLEKINTFALSIQAKQTIEALMQNDYFYQPALANLLNLPNQLGAQAFWGNQDEH